MAGGLPVRLYHVFAGWDDYYSVAEHEPVPHALLSWAYLRPLDKAKQILDRIRENGTETIFLDSGAFSVQRSGASIDLDEYMNAVEVLQPTAYAALDVIGDPLGTEANLKRMVDAGMKPVPVFTYGAPWLDFADLINDFDYVAMGGLVGRSKTIVIEHFARAFNVMYTRGKIGPPPVRLHAFGVSWRDLLLGYPVYSCDTASVIKSAAYGQARVVNAVGALVGVVPNRKREDAWRMPHLSDRVTGRKEYLRRRVVNARAMNRMAETVTTAWTTRGVEW